MKFTRKQMNGFFVLLIIILCLSITVLAFSDTIWSSLIGAGLIGSSLILLFIFLRQYSNFKRNTDKQFIERKSIEINSIESKMTIDYTMNILIQKSYMQIESPINNDMIFTRKRRYIVLHLSDNLKASFEYLYDYYSKLKDERHIMEFFPIVFVSIFDTSELNLLSEYYKKDLFDEIETNSIIEFISEDGSGFSNPSIFQPMICSGDKLYFINAAQSKEIVRMFDVNIV